MIPELQAFFLVCGLGFALWWLFWYFGRDGRLIGEWARARGWRIGFQEHRQLASCPFSGEERPTQVIYIEAIDAQGARYKGYLSLPGWRLHGRQPVRFVSQARSLRPET